MLSEYVSVASRLKRAPLVLAALMVAGLAWPQQTAPPGRKPPARDRVS